MQGQSRAGGGAGSGEFALQTVVDAGLGELGGGSANWWRRGELAGRVEAVVAADGVDFAAEQDGDAGHVHPQHEDDDGGEGAVGGAVVAEVGDVEAESRGGQGDEDGGDHVAGGKEAEFGFGVGGDEVGDGQGEQERGGDDDPAQGGEDDAEGVAPADERGDPGLNGSGEDDQGDGADDQHGIEEDEENGEAAGLPEGARVGDGADAVDLLDQGVGAGGSRPEGEDDAEGHEALFASGDVADGSVEELGGLRGEDLVEEIDQGLAEVGDGEHGQQGEQEDGGGNDGQHEEEGEDGGAIEDAVVLHLAPQLRRETPNAWEARSARGRSLLSRACR